MQDESRGRKNKDYRSRYLGNNENPVRGEKTYQCRTSTENKRKRKTALLCAYVQAARLLVGAARLGSADDCAIDV